MKCINKYLVIYQQTHTHTHTNSCFSSRVRKPCRQSVNFFAVQEQIYGAAVGLRRILEPSSHPEGPATVTMPFCLGSMIDKSAVGFVSPWLLLPYRYHSTIFRTLSIINHSHHVRVILATVILNNTYNYMLRWTFQEATNNLYQSRVQSVHWYW